MSYTGQLGESAMSAPWEDYSSGPWSDYKPSQKIDEPLKIGKAGFEDAMRSTLNDEGWIGRNYAGVGTVFSDLYEGAKQFFGKGDTDQIQANKIIADEAPIGAFAGNAALAAIPMGGTSAGLKGAALVGGAFGALQPTENNETWQDRLKAKLINTGMGAAAGATGQVVADTLGKALASRLARNTNAMTANAPIDQTLAAARQEGFVVPPTSVNPALMNQLKEGIAGKIATAQTASNVNADLTDALARRAVGLPTNAPLTSDAMQAIRKQAFQQGYEPVAQIGMIPTDAKYQMEIDQIANKFQGAAKSFPGAISDDVSALIKPFKVGQFDAGDALQASQYLRDKAQQAFRNGDTGLGKAAKDASKAIEDQIERSLSLQIGGNTTYPSPQDLLKNFRDARQLMAKSHTIEDAIVKGGGTINAKKLAARVQAGKPLTDELKTIGDFANNFPKAMQPRQQVAGPAVSKLNSFSSLMGAVLGGAGGGIPGGLVGAAAPFVIPPAMRARLLSEAVQNGLLDEKYAVPLMLRGGNALSGYLAPAGIAGAEAFSQ